MMNRLGVIRRVRHMKRWAAELRSGLPAPRLVNSIGEAAINSLTSPSGGRLLGLLYYLSCHGMLDSLTV